MCFRTTLSKQNRKSRSVFIRKFRRFFSTISTIHRSKKMKKGNRNIETIHTRCVHVWTYTPYFYFRCIFETRPLIKTRFEISSFQTIQNTSFDYKRDLSTMLFPFRFSIFAQTNFFFFFFLSRANQLARIELKSTEITFRVIHTLQAIDGENC